MLCFTLYIYIYPPYNFLYMTASPSSFKNHQRFLVFILFSVFLRLLHLLLELVVQLVPVLSVPGQQVIHSVVHGQSPVVLLLSVLLQ